MDEFHYYADRERGVAWQVPLLTLPQARFLLMSATLGDTTFFEEELTRLNGPAHGHRRLHGPARAAGICLFRTAAGQDAGKPRRRGQARRSMSSISRNWKRPRARRISPASTSARARRRTPSRNALEGFKFTSPYGPEIKKWLSTASACITPGLLPKYRVLVEQLAQKGLLKIICGTDTLGVGINVPIRTVLFTRLCKFDGQKTGILSARDFHQIGGRAGRKGFDDRGWVVAQAPEHVIENLKLAEKAARDGKKTVKRQPPEKNFVNWDKNTFARLIAAPPERLTSRFQVSHGMLLNVLSRKGDGCRAMQQLIRDCHETPKAKKDAHANAPGNCSARCWTARSSSSSRKTRPDGAYLRVNVELAGRFLHGPGAVACTCWTRIPLVDPQAPDYALVLLTLVESILEDPDIILRKQLDKVKDQKMAEMKMEGIEYDQRMEELEKLEYPKPNREFVYSTFNAFADRHPWVGQENIRPKSIAREMFESFRSFSDYIRDYELQRAEGVLLRHLNSVFKVLAANRARHRQERPVREMELYLAHDDPPGGFQPARRMGEDARPELPARRNQGSRARPAPKKPPPTSRATPKPSPPPSATASSPSCAGW